MFTLAISPSFAIMQMMALLHSMSTARSAPGRKHFVKYFVAKRIANEVNLPFDPAKENYPAREFVEGTVRYALGGVLTVDLTSPGIKDPVSRELRPVKYILDGKYDESQIFEGYHYRLSDLKVGEVALVFHRPLGDKGLGSDSLLDCVEFDGRTVRVVSAHEDDALAA